MRSLQFVSKRVFFSGAVLGRHVYQISDGSIVTGSITLSQYMGYAIISRRKRCLSIGQF